jgi:signal transduction histidine kinase
MNSLSEHLRASKQEIEDMWERQVRTSLPALDRLSRSSLVDHLPEFLDGLSSWIEGDSDLARSGFDALAEGHALQRLGYGVDLETLTREYAALRSTLMRMALDLPHTDQLHEHVVRLDEGMDEAIIGAIRRYMEVRDRARDRFIGILAHDLRSPLNTISIAASRLVVAPEPDEKLHRIGNMILRSTERMGRMIHDVIEFARAHLGGGIPVALTRGDLGELCNEVVEELTAGHPHRDLSITCSGDLRGQWDHDRVLQAMTNLIGNSLQHGQDPVRVTVVEAADRRSISTSVNNRGRVIPIEEQRTLFDPFRSGASSKGGLGLGLYIVQQIALAHGARCEVRCSEPDGITFTIVWPRTPNEETPNRP